MELTKKCPYCAEVINANAIVCKHCGLDIKTGLKAGVQKQQDKKGLSVEDGVKTGCGMFIVLPILIIVGLILFVLVGGGLVKSCN